MVTVSSLPASDLPRVRRLHNRFTTSDVALETVQAWYDETPELFVGAYVDDELIGYCLGVRRAEERVELRGIGIQPAHRREGIGSTLVEVFDDRVAALDVERVRTESPGGYIDRFYTGNGFGAEAVLVRSRNATFPDDYSDLEFDVVDKRREDDVTKLYVDVDEVDRTFINDVRTAFGECDAVYIMEKTVG